jgi:hypothetical protein
MIAQYTTIFQQICYKCEKLVGGSKLQLPVVRKLVVTKDGDKRWVAGHEECLA